jgi:hypothetical protein
MLYGSLTIAEYLYILSHLVQEGTYFHLVFNMHLNRGLFSKAISTAFFDYSNPSDPQ